MIFVLNIGILLIIVEIFILDLLVLNLILLFFKCFLIGLLFLISLGILFVWIILNGFL